MIKLKFISEEEIYLNELNDANNWMDLSMNYELSEDIMEKFLDKIDWIYVSKFQRLSENFIRRHKDKEQKK